MKNISAVGYHLKAILFIPCLLILTSARGQKNDTPLKALPFTDQLFIYFESAEAKFCDQSGTGSNDVFGAIYFTQKGHVIFHLSNEHADTIRYFWGNYHYTDTSITYQLTNEYYYHGKWDARWDAPDPDYKKGKARKINSTEVTLLKSKCISYPYSHPYTKKEKAEAAKRYLGIKPYGLIYQPYHEPENMKYFTWLFKQIPVLASLF